MTKPVPQDALNKTLFGIVPFTDLFEKWIYCKSVTTPGRGNCTPAPPGFVFMASEYREKVHTWYNDSVIRESLNVLAKQHVTDKIYPCLCDGPVTSYRLTPWKETGHALITATDHTMIPNTYVAVPEHGPMGIHHLGQERGGVK